MFNDVHPLCSLVRHSEAASGHQDVNLHALTPTLLADLAFQVRGPLRRSHTLTRLQEAPAVEIRSERSSLSPGKRLHHQRSSRHAMVPLSDTSPHPGG
jgi:hypothetical protein